MGSLTIHKGMKPTEAQIQEIEHAATLPIVFDEDCPNLSEEQLNRMAAIARERRSLQKKGSTPVLMDMV